MLGNTEGIYNIFGMRVYSGVSVTWLLPPPDNAVIPHFFLNGGLHAAISAASESDTARERACVCVCVCVCVCMSSAMFSTCPCVFRRVCASMLSQSPRIPFGKSSRR